MTSGKRRSLPEVPALWITLAALLAVTPLLIHGNTCGHDLSFHLQNWMEAGQQWKHGTLRPFWCFNAAWNAGEPRFVFYPPLSWTLGALLGLVLPWPAVPASYTLVALLLSGLAMHRLLRQFTPGSIAILGACMYLANPYMLFVAFERSAEAELLAAAWMPLLLLAVLRPQVDALRLALPVALLWLTNAPAAVVGSYALLLIAMVRLVHDSRKPGPAPLLRQAVQMAGGYALGFSLAGFYVLPAVVQRRAVQIEMAVLPGMRPQDNFLFGHTGEPLHDAVLHTASWIAVILLAVAFTSAAWLIRVGRSPAERLPAYSLIPLIAVIAFLLTPTSRFIWLHAPELAFLQFPWRFLAMGAAVTTTLLALALPLHLPARVTLPAALLLTALFVFSAHSRFAQPCDDEDAPAAQRQHFLHDPGTEPTDEYTPKDADNDALKPALPAAWLASMDDLPPPAQPDAEIVTLSDGNPNHLSFRIAPLPVAKILVIRLRGFRGWHMERDGLPMPGTTTRDDGLLSVPLTAGAPHAIDIRYQWTADERAGLALSAAAALVCVALASRSVPSRKR